jgi:hypothetical protein
MITASAAYPPFEATNVITFPNAEAEHSPAGSLNIHNIRLYGQVLVGRDGPVEKRA